VLVNGSARLVATLLEHDLVDELRLMVFPVVLGGGKRLFDGSRAPLSFELVEAKPAGETVILVYRRKAEA
jgi:dihydrofolate reductase